MNLCHDCKKAPRVDGRSYCYQCKYTRDKRAKKVHETSTEYKIGAHGFVYINIMGDWIKSSLTPKEARI